MDDSVSIDSIVVIVVGIKISALDSSAVVKSGVDASVKIDVRFVCSRLVA